jgi:hypothetical protein
MAHLDEEMNVNTIELVVAEGNEQGFRKRAVFAAALVASLLVVAVTRTTRPRSEDDALLFSRVLQSKGDTGLWGSTHSADMPTAAPTPAASSTTALPVAARPTDTLTAAPMSPASSIPPRIVPCNSYAVMDVFNGTLSAPDATTEPTSSDYDQVAAATLEFFKEKKGLVGWEIQSVDAVAVNYRYCNHEDCFETMALPGHFNLRVKMRIMVTLLSSNCRDNEDFTLEGNLDDGLQAAFAVYITNYVQELTGIPFASTNETAYTLPYNGGSCLCDYDSFSFSHS